MTVLIAHRGVSAYAPENTHAAFTLAWALDCAGIELDVQVSRDGRAVVCHDETLLRTGGLDVRIDASGWDAISGTDVGSFKGAQFAGERLPLLADVLAQMPAGKTIQVEVKPEVENLAPIIEVLKTARRDIAIWLMCFDAGKLKTLKTALPELPALYLLEKKDAEDAQAACDFALAQGFDGLDVEHSAVDAGFAAACKNAGLTLGVWTVDTQAEAVRLAALGIDMIASNRPQDLTI